MTGLAFTTRALTAPADFAACQFVYQEAFGLRSEDGSLNPRLLTGLSHNSGIVVGAHAGGELVGFALSFLAREHGRLDQYSQTAAVRPPWQGKGVGRAIKFAQRELVLAAGLDLLRWTFDPLLPANAHFNLDVLGGIAVRLVPDMYGALGAPAERGEPSDRFVVDWDLRAASRQEPAPAGPGELSPGELRTSGETSWLAVPADWQAFRRSSPGETMVMRERITGHAGRLLAAGLAAVSCIRLNDQVALYRFARRERW